jgi:two-component system OmpR family response regulator
MRIRPGSRRSIGGSIEKTALASLGAGVAHSRFVPGALALAVRAVDNVYGGGVRVRILVVEDDSLLAEGLQSVLARAGHAVEHVALGRHADAMLSDQQFDLVVLDVGLPDIDGFEVLRRLRLRQTPTNVLVLTARDAVEDRVHGLDLGADDYLTKPFSVTEFEARVRALLRRTAAPAAFWSVAGMTVDGTAKRVRVKDRPVDLTPREWALLELFLTHPGRVLSKDQIAESLYSFDEQLSTNAIEVHVSRLRTKIGNAGAHIRTVRGFGYLWEGDDGQ